MRGGEGWGTTKGESKAILSDRNNNQNNSATIIKLFSEQLSIAGKLISHSTILYKRKWIG